MVAEEKTVVAPMLEAFLNDNAYSNYWAAVDEQGLYKTDPKYFEIIRRQKTGTFEVPMVHSTFLIDMDDPRVNKLQWYPVPEQYEGIRDNIMVVAWTMRQANIPMHVCNKNVYGFLMVPYNETLTLQERHQVFTNAFVDYAAFNIQPLRRSAYIPHTFPQPNKRGFDEIYMINLERRTDRRMKMEVGMRELGLEYKYFPAVDGRTLSPEKVKELGIVPMTEFRDPFFERPITMGEIGCFLSHYNIWVEMIEKGMDMIMVLEDDVRFEDNFNQRLDEVMKEARGLIKKGVEWDLIYLGRKPLVTSEPEIGVDGCEHLVWAKYSYWTLGYILRLSGARQLVEGEPLSKVIPVDEYIPIKYDEHSNEDLSKLYHPRNMIGLSTHPLLMFPTHYTSDPGHYSDTDDTLSFEGNDVSHFREKKYEELKKKREVENAENRTEENMNEEDKIDIKDNDVGDKVHYNVPNRHEEF